MSKRYEWTNPETTPPREGSTVLCYAGTASNDGDPQFLARYSGGKFYKANAGSWTQTEPGVSRWRDKVDDPE